jgi:hypothetical protein
MDKEGILRARARHEARAPEEVAPIPAQLSPASVGPATGHGKWTGPHLISAPIPHRAMWSESGKISGTMRRVLRVFTVICPVFVACDVERHIVGSLYFQGFFTGKQRQLSFTRPVWGTGGREFKSRRSDQLNQTLSSKAVFTSGVRGFCSSTVPPPIFPRISGEEDIERAMTAT